MKKGSTSLWETVIRIAIAALTAALKLADEIGSGNIVAVFPDRGDRYISKGLFD